MQAAVLCNYSNSLRSADECCFALNESGMHWLNTFIVLADFHMQGIQSNPNVHDLNLTPDVWPPKKCIALKVIVYNK